MKTGPHRRSLRIRVSLLGLIILVLAQSPCSGSVNPGISRSGPLLSPLAKTWNVGRDTLMTYPGSDLGGEIRLRLVDYQNALGLGSEPDPHRRFFRIRGRLWYSRRFSPSTRIVAGLANESFVYLECESCDSKLGEIIFEQLYLEWINQKGRPLGLRIGRQDLFYGDGLLVCDGGPLDGSRTTYVNGAVLSTRIPLWAFDIFTAYDPKTDEYLPRINNRHRALVEHYEFLAGIVARRLAPEGGRSGRLIEPYYLYKQESDRPRTARLHTIGVKLGFPVWRTDLAAELAYQYGKVPKTEIPVSSPVKVPNLAGPQSVSAYAASVKLGMDLGGPVPGNIALGYVYLQGDERTTRNKYEGWNPILGRWPIWSELYIYTLTMEREAHPMKQGIAFWQNLEAPYLDFRLSLRRDIGLSGRYMHLGATESIFSDPLSEGSLDRGDLFLVHLSYGPRSDWSAHLHFEVFRPGDFYTPFFEAVDPDGPRDATFFRLEVKRTF